MKPKIGVVFPKITDKDIADLEIEKIRVSKNRRKIGIYSKLSLIFFYFRAIFKPFFDEKR